MWYTVTPAHYDIKTKARRMLHKVPLCSMKTDDIANGTIQIFAIKN